MAAAGIVHRDLLRHNVLVAAGEGGGRAVIADFGLAAWEPRPAHVGQPASGGGGTADGAVQRVEKEWKIPCVSEGRRYYPTDDVYTSAADVFMFGACCLWEVRPFPSLVLPPPDDLPSSPSAPCGWPLVGGPLWVAPCGWPRVGGPLWVASCGPPTAGSVSPPRAMCPLPFASPLSQSFAPD